MLKWLLTLGKKPDPVPESVPESVREKVNRLEIDLEELRGLVQAVWARQRKVEGAVHGMRGASRRWPGRADTDDETLEEYRDRMVREGRMRATGGTNDGGSG